MGSNHTSDTTSRNQSMPSGPDHRNVPAVVVPAIGSSSSVACLRSLGRRGVRTIAVGESESAPGFRSKYCHQRCVVPPASEDLVGYGDALVALAKRPDVVTILPLREPDIYVLSKRRSDFAAHVSTPWPQFDVIRRIHDWVELRDVAAAAGVPTPKTGLLDEWDDWDRPTVIKPRYSLVVEGNRVRFPEMYFLEAGARPDVAAIEAEMGHVPIVQEYIPGDAEHGFFALLDEGGPVATFQHRRVRSFKYWGGASVYRESVDVPTLHAQGLAMLQELDYHGVAMVEFKRDQRDGRLKLIEINPRFWGSLPLAVQAGVDFPALLYELAAGGDSSSVTGAAGVVDCSHATGYSSDVGCHLLRGEISYLHSVLFEENPIVAPPPLRRALPRLLGSLARNPHFDYLDFGDSVPFFADILDVAADLITGEGDR